MIAPAYLINPQTRLENLGTLNPLSATGVASYNPARNSRSLS